MLMKIITNTYPKHPNTPHAEEGDIVHWEHSSKGVGLIRDSDKARLFRTAPVDRNGNLYSNGQPPVLIGIIGRVKSKGWILEIR